MIEDWGQTPDGTGVKRITLRGGGLTARVLSFGAALQSLRMEGWPHPLTLGHPTLAPYVENHGHIGVVVGRFANRIAKGRARIAGTEWQFDRNFLGRHTLHGGADCAAFAHWDILDVGADFARLATVMPDGHMGFPGNLRVEITYALKADGVLDTQIEAATDAPTLCNFTTHNYFNLDSRPSIAAHWLQVDADTVLPLDADGIPTGGPEDVARHDVDFRARQSLGRDGKPRVLDCNLCLSQTRVARRHVGTLGSAASGIAMDVATTEPGFQIYSGAGLRTPFSGFAIEPQLWPDAPNQPGYPSAELHPGDRYLHETRFTFRAP